MKHVKLFEDFTTPVVKGMMANESVMPDTPLAECDEAMIKSIITANKGVKLTDPETETFVDWCIDCGDKELAIKTLQEFKKSHPEYDKPEREEFWGEMLNKVVDAFPELIDDDKK